MRVATNEYTDKTQHLHYDVVVIGAGIAGLYTALHIDDKHSCCILTKEDAEVSNSWLAQGGIAAALSLDDAMSHRFATCSNVDACADHSRSCRPMRRPGCSR